MVDKQMKGTFEKYEAQRRRVTEKYLNGTRVVHDTALPGQSMHSGPQTNHATMPNFDASADFGVDRSQSMLDASDIRSRSSLTS